MVGNPGDKDPGFNRPEIPKEQVVIYPSRFVELGQAAGYKKETCEGFWSRMANDIAHQTSEIIPGVRPASYEYYVQTEAGPVEIFRQMPGPDRNHVGFKHSPTRYRDFYLVLNASNLMALRESAGSLRGIMPHGRADFFEAVLDKLIELAPKFRVGDVVMGKRDGLQHVVTGKPSLQAVNAGVVSHTPEGEEALDIFSIGTARFEELTEEPVEHWDIERMVAAIVRSGTGDSEQKIREYLQSLEA